jgi:hypothetical protein
MEAYFVRDKDPWGGTISVFRGMPVASEERITIQEIRHGDFPAEIWLQIFFGEVKPDPVKHHDDIYQQYYDAATVVWTREGGSA